MDEFTFLFKLEPAGDFGLPEQDTIVTTAVRNIYSAAIHRLTLNTVSHGTLSRYREENEAIRLDEHMLGLRMSLHDNYLWVVLLKEDYKAAELIVLAAVDRFTQLLAVDRGTYFSAEFLHATVKSGAEEVLARHPKSMSLFRLKPYNLPAFTESLREALRSVSLTGDAKLAKALDYCNHAQFLNKVRDDLPFGYARAHSHLVADIFSNYYRAASVIVGDPKKDRDYQSRYKKIGLSDDDWKTVERVRALRNNYGVAHYDLEDKSEQLKQELAMAVAVTKKVITCYITSLHSKEVSEADAGHHGNTT
jgi:hypothetical protein